MDGGLEVWPEASRLTDLSCIRAQPASSSPTRHPEIPTGIPVQRDAACSVHEDALVFVENAVQEGSAFVGGFVVDVVFMLLGFGLDDRNLVLF